MTPYVSSIVSMGNFLTGLMNRVNQSKSATRQFLLLDTLVDVVMAVMREHAIS